MRRLAGHMLGVDQGSEVLFSDFEDGGPMWTGQGPRSHRVPVRFSGPFLAPPVVHIALSMWDMDRRTNQRVDLTSEDVGLEGFTLVFKTWGDTRVARVRANWMAIGEVLSEEDWDIP